MSGRPLERHTKMIAAGIALFLIAAVGLLIWHINGPRVVARAVSPEGIEMCIVQRCNWSVEPFTTRFFYRKPGTDWIGFYYDHQDWYWGSGTVSLNTNLHEAVFFRDGVPVVTFDWDVERYTLHRSPTIESR